MVQLRQGLTAVFALALAACASVPYAQRVAQRQSLYAAAAGAPVNNFHFFSLYSWVPLGDHQLAVYTHPNRAWLLDVSSCPNLRFANTIGLSSSVNQVSVRFDKVFAGGGYPPCWISRIRPLDVAKLRVAQQARHEIRAAPREPAVQG